MSLQLKVGRYYRTRDGGTVGPLEAADNRDWPFTNGKLTWTTNGSYEPIMSPNHQYDIVEEVPAPNSPEITVQTICELYNAQSEHSIAAGIELPAEDLHALALSWYAMNNLLGEIFDGVKASQGKQNDLLAKIKSVMKGGEA
jgi:hypothetical protein